MSDVAVVGMSCRFPGAGDVHEYRELVVAGREGLRRTTTPAPLVPVVGRVPHALDIDPAAFGLGETDAQIMDPQHRVFLECARDALDSAGHGAGAARGTVGVYVGAGLSGYLTHNLADRFDATGGADPIASLHLHTANVADYLPLRVAHLLDLDGPSMAIGATCATSLVAVHTAVQALLAHECDTALAGGVSLQVPPPDGYVAVPDGPFSPDGHTRAYSRAAAGTVFTDGAGCVTLRRLDDALADGDTIHAVIRGSALTNDGGGKVGFTAPTIAGQAAAIEQALAVAGLEPRDVGLIEGHGTATALGDRIEIAALRQVWGAADAPWCALGSVKSNIGHTSSAAGVAGLIKAVLAVRDGEIYPTLHADAVEELTGSPFYLPETTRPWDGDVRRAGVSAFGIGGVNCHVVIEQPPQRPDRGRPTGGPRLLAVSAASSSAATAWRDETLAEAQRLAADDRHALADVAATLANGRAAMPHRATAVIAETGRQLTSHEHLASDARVVLAFPGAGEQRRGLLRDSAAGDPQLRQHLEAVTAAIERAGGPALLDVLVDPSSDEPLTDPAVGLPALFAAEVAMARRLVDLGVRPDAVVGHSVGEYAAAVLAGGLDLDDAASLVVARSAAMARTAPGRMLAVALDENSLNEVLLQHARVDLAAVNGPESCVVAGPTDAIGRLNDDLRRAEVRTTVVGINVAAHSHLVDPARPALDEVAGTLTPRPLTIELYSTLTGRRVTDEEWNDTGRWSEHLRRTVRFADALDAAMGAQECVVISCGPGSTIPWSARAMGAQRLRAVVTPFTARDEDQLGDGQVAYLDAVGALWACGVDINLGALTGPVDRRVTLPTYPYERRRMYVEPVRRGTVLIGPPPTEASASEPLQLPTWREVPPATAIASDVLVLGAGQCADRLRDLFGRPAVDRPGAVVAAIDTERGASERERLGSALHQIADVAHQLAAIAGDAHDVLPVVLVQHAPESGPSGTNADDPVATAISGTMRVVGQEIPGIRWRTVDVDDLALSGGALRAEVGDLAASGETGWEVRLRGHTRQIRSWQSWAPAPVGDDPLGRGATVLITGGLGSVGLALAERWGAEYGARIVLASRRVTGLRERDDERSIEQRTIVSALRGRGVDVELAQLDVADAAAVDHLLARLTRERGPIDLIVHAPVALELAPLAELDNALVAANLAAKVDGVVALEAAIDGLGSQQRPRRVVLMSSAAGTIGGFGLAAYVAASRFLDAVARRRHAQGWVALDWDRWRFGTAAEAEAVSEITMRHALEADDALQALERILTLPVVPPQIAISPGALDPRSIVLPQRAVVAAGGAEDLRTDGEQLVAEVWSGVLGAPVTSRGDDFFARGGHSLLATRVLAELRERSGVPLRLRDLLQAPTVAALAALLHLPDNTAPDPSRSAGSDFGSEARETLGQRPQVGRAEGAEVSAPFGLTRVQTAYLLGRQSTYELGGVGCHFHLEIACPTIDVDRFAAAWRVVVARHEMLRTVVDRTGRNHPLDPPPEVSLRVHDLSSASGHRALDELAQLRAASAHRVADPAQWPLVEPVVVLMPDGDHRLLISVDVLVCDSASWMLIDREMRSLYEHPDLELPAPVTTFADCVAALDQRAGSAERQEAWEYWRPRAETLPPAPAIQTRLLSGEQVARPVPRFVRRRAVIDAATWAQIREQAAARRLTPTTAVLAAYAETLAAWSWEEHFSITLTVFDRPDIEGVDDVVGEFSSLLLLERTPPPIGDLGSAATMLQKQLHGDLPHTSVSGLEVLAEQARRTGRQRNVPVVFTSMIGLDTTPDGRQHDHEWLGPVVDGVSQTPQTWLDHQAFELRGDLILQWDVNESAVDALDADDAFGAYVERLRQLTESSGWHLPATYPPSNAPGAAQEMVPESVMNDASERHYSEVDQGGVLRAAVRGVWTEVLGVDAEQIDEDSTFLALGGDSLLAVRMAALLAEHTGHTLPLSAVRSETTVGEVVSALLAGDDDQIFAGERAELERTGRQQNGADLEQHDSWPGVPIHETSHAAATFELTSLQRAYWLGQRTSWELPACPASVVTVVPCREVDHAAVAEQLHAAMEALLRRHPMLRLTITEDGLQTIRDADDPTCAPRLEVHDLRDVDGSTNEAVAKIAGRLVHDTAEQSAALQRIRHDASHRVVDPLREPCLWLGVSRLDDRVSRVHLGLDLMFCDATSALTVVDSLQEALRGDEVRWPSERFEHWIADLDAARGDQRRVRAERHFAERASQLPPAPALELTIPEAGKARFVRREHRFAADWWRSLRAAAAAQSVTPTGLLLGVLARTLGRFTGEADHTVVVTVFDRPAAHRGVIGDYTTTVLAGLPGARDPLPTTARAIQRKLWADLEHAVGSHGVHGNHTIRELLRLGRPARFPIAYSSGIGSSAGIDGVSRDAGRLLDRWGTVVYAVSQTPNVVLDVQTFEDDDDLVVRWDGVDAALPSEFLDLAFDFFVAELQAAPLAYQAASAPHTPRHSDPPASPGPESARGDVKGTIARLLADQLGCAPSAVDPAAPFFDLGATSLTLVQLQRRLSSVGIESSVLDFFRHPSINLLAAALGGEQPVTLAADLAGSSDSVGTTTGRARGAQRRALRAIGD